MHILDRDIGEILSEVVFDLVLILDEAGRDGSGKDRIDDVLAKITAASFSFDVTEFAPMGTAGPEAAILA